MAMSFIPSHPLGTCLEAFILQIVQGNSGPAYVVLLWRVHGVGTKYVTTGQAQKGDLWMLPNTMKKIKQCREPGSGMRRGLRGLFLVRWSARASLRK